MHIQHAAGAPPAAQACMACEAVRAPPAAAAWRAAGCGEPASSEPTSAAAATAVAPHTAQDKDMAYWKVDFNAINARCHEKGVLMQRHPFPDFNAEGLRHGLPTAVAQLHGARPRPHGRGDGGSAQYASTDSPRACICTSFLQAHSPPARQAGP